MESSDGRRGGGRRAGAKGSALDRLPPPAFPPGIRRSWDPQAAEVASGGVGRGGFPEGALISPNEPIRRIGEGFPEGAFISPDDPIDQNAGGADHDVEVTGIGSRNPKGYPLVSRSPAGPREPEEVSAILEELARRLREHGSAALATDAHVSSFESALRGFLGGYLVGRGRGSG